MRAALLVLASCLVGVACIELAWRVVGTTADDTRYVLFAQDGGGTVFRNRDDFFTYQPAATISTAGWYATPGGWVREYGYRYRTNGLGLVQSTDVVPGKPALLLLGDSFTEGQGAPPWFESFAAAQSGRPWQSVNGGLLATGFGQWRVLHDHLVGQGVEVARLVVVFISDDYARRAWTIPPEIPRCIDDYRNCRGGERFYGTPPEAEIAAFLERMRAARDAEARSAASSDPRKAFARAFPALTRIGRFVALRLDLAAGSGAAGESDRAISAFVDAYGRRVVFVHLPERDELARGVSPSGVAARESIRAAGGRLYDGFAGCGLMRADYGALDPHPTAQGYAKIARCVGDAVTMVEE